MEHYYTGERNHQILISLLKQHNIKNVVVSPGIANSVFVGSIQNDPFFHIISVVDERSAAYVACGMAFETGEPVVISCTGATAARDYMPGMTEAYYSKLPILAVTSSQPTNRIGHMFAQVTDRTAPPSDVANISVEMSTVRTPDDEWACMIAGNKAILELKRNGGGPAHINLITAYGYNETTALTHKEIPAVRKIERYDSFVNVPEIPSGKIGIFVGNHLAWSKELTECVDKFCACYNAVVFCDHTSNYNGKYKNLFALAINQATLNKANIPAYELDLCIHIGEISGEEGSPRMIKSKETWRVSADGEIRDYFRNLVNVFEMTEETFFNHYSSNGSIKENTFIQEVLSRNQQLKKVVCEQLSEMPLSNVWIAQNTASWIPSGSTITLSILNTLRTWNYAEFNKDVQVLCPTGGFGIDGVPSIAFGASVVNPSKLSFCIVGDLAFFYDMNSIGNRFVGNNLRIMIVNNGCGVEFKKTYAMSYRLLGEDVDPFVAAKGHFCHKSKDIVKHFAEDLGFKYFCAHDKDEFNANIGRFTDVNIKEPIVFEVFVNDSDEAKALNIIHNRN